MSQYLERVDTKNSILQTSLIVTKCNHVLMYTFTEFRDA